MRRAYGWGYAALRYFNASGASADGDIGEDHDPETHLIPLILQVALGQREHITVFGDQFPTPDGTCIRDYIHVDDLATAHLAALDRLEKGTELKLNLGTGQGSSVREVIETCREVTGRPIPAVVAGPRAGDPPALVADASLARRELDWEPQYTTIRPIIETAWRWHKAHPHGYGDRRSTLIDRRRNVLTLGMCFASQDIDELICAAGAPTDVAGVHGCADLAPALRADRDRPVAGGKEPDVESSLVHGG